MRGYQLHHEYRPPNTNSDCTTFVPLVGEAAVLCNACAFMRCCFVHAICIEVLVASNMASIACGKSNIHNQCLEEKAGDPNLCWLTSSQGPGYPLPYPPPNSAQD